MKVTKRRVLIIGLGFSGSRFLKVLSYFNLTDPMKKFEIAVVDQDPEKLNNIPNVSLCFNNLESAIENFLPNICIVTVNEKDHFKVLQKLSKIKTDLILCEKPLVENMQQAEAIYEKLRGKCLSMNMVERFSPIIQKFFEWRSNHTEIETSRVEFFWGKNRIKDNRPTIGAISEIIHPLDLIDFIFGYKEIKILNAISTESDFSISGESIIDSFDLIANTDKYMVLGHSSFLWARRHREIIGFMKNNASMFRVNFTFDNPFWDCDQLVIEQIFQNGRKTTVLEYQTKNSDFPDELNQVFKVSQFISQSVLTSEGNQTFEKNIVNLLSAVRVQKTLEEIKNVANSQRMDCINLFGYKHGKNDNLYKSLEVYDE